MLIQNVLFAVALSYSYCNLLAGFEDAGVDYTNSYYMKAAGTTVQTGRDYCALPTDEERDCISCIVTTLGNKSLAKIWKDKSYLKKLGDKVNNVHPLRFLSVIFTSEELTAAMKNLVSRDWIWSEFKNGLYESLTEEKNNHNLRMDQVFDFSAAVNIPHELLMHSVQQSDWDGLIQSIIQNIPSNGQSNRYDM